MKEIYDIAIIGAGVVGCAIARELSRHQLKVALVEAAPDVGMGTSKANTAIWHTGFDAKPGSLEARLMRRSYTLMDKFMPEANIAHERLGAILIAWTPAQMEALPSLERKAHENGVTDVSMVSVDEIYRREPNINQGALGGLLVPGEGILCTFSVSLAFAYQAVLNGTGLYLNFTVQDARRKDDVWTLTPGTPGIAEVPGTPSNGVGEPIHARYVINAAGLHSDEINALMGHGQFKVTPRRGQLIIYDKLARTLVNHVLLPVPTSVSKGVLICPTVYGNVLLGPTAEDIDDKSATQTTTDGLNGLLEKGRLILPKLGDEEITATYSGLRAATEHSDYQIQMHADEHYLCVGGIRSTGISAAMGIAEYAGELLRGAGLVMQPKPTFEPVKMPSIGQADVRPCQNAEMIARDPSYAQMTCHCEGVSYGEVRDAMRAIIPATNLDGIRRRTRASQGRCQGFNCHAALAAGLQNQTATRPVSIRVQPGSGGNKTADILIVGAGPAGLAAAIGLKKLGVKNVLVVDREAEAGGMPRYCDHTGFGRQDLWRMYSGPRYARHYRELAQSMKVDIQTSTTITGWTSTQGDEGLSLRYTSPGGLGQVRARAVLLATGIRERPRAARLVPGTRPQGIFTTGSLQRYLHEEHLPVGKLAVIVGAELVSLSALMMLWEAGIQCAMMVTPEPKPQIYFPYTPMKWAITHLLTRTPVVTRSRISNILGQKRVEGVEITSENGQPRIIACDAVIFTGDWIPENEMARLGGLTIDSGTHGPQADSGFHSSVPGVFAAGNLLRGVATADQCALEGARAAESIAAYLNHGTWPASRLAIRCEPPLAWVFPNSIDAANPPGELYFTSSQFRRDARLQVRQGNALVHDQPCRSIVVNEIMKIRGTWGNKIDPHGQVISVSLA